MKEYRVEVEAFDFISIDSLSICHQANEHSRAKVCGKVSCDYQEEYLSTLVKESWTRIYAIDSEGGEQIVFVGIVTAFAMVRKGHDTVLKLELFSGTILMDRSYHLRTFQNQNLTYQNIFEQLTKTYAKSKVNYNLSNNDKISNFIIQYRESDWQFLKRMAGRQGGYLIPSHLTDGVQYFVGLPNRGQRRLPNEFPYTIQRRTGAVRNARGVLETQNRIQFVINSRELYQIGENLSFQGQSLFIVQAESVYEKGELLHTYTMATAGNMFVNACWNEEIAGSSLDGWITKVKADKVQVNIYGDENKNQNYTKWFPYSTVYSSPDGTGWYCMPEVGDAIRLNLPVFREEEAHVISAVHLEAGAADRQEPNLKSLKTKYGKEVLFTPDSIVMTNNKGMSISLKDGQGINVVSDKDVNISAGNNVTLASQGGSLSVAGSSGVKLSQGGTGIQLDSNIVFSGGEFRIQ